jgi:hypothetical protein
MNALPSRPRKTLLAALVGRALTAACAADSPAAAERLAAPDAAFASYDIEARGPVRLMGSRGAAEEWSQGRRSMCGAALLSIHSSSTKALESAFSRSSRYG